MDKSLDSMFMHYGIRREDMEIIKGICEKHEVDFDWFKDEVLRVYHEEKTKHENIDMKSLQNLLENALSKK